MRTTKVKRLGPVMALALVFALVAVVGVSLWHSGPAPGGLTPPAAEAQERTVTNPTPIPYDDPCRTAGVDDAGDLVCITEGDELWVSTTMSTGNQLGYLYVTGANASNDEPSNRNDAATFLDWYPNIQAEATAGGDKLGKKGVGEYAILAGDARGDLPQGLEVRRSWADADGEVYVFIKENHADWNRPEATATALPTFDTAGGAFVIVRVIFIQDQALDNPDTVTALTAEATDKLPAKREATNPTDRRFEIEDAENGGGDDDEAGKIGFSVNSSSASDAIMPGIGGQLEVVTTFTTGSALKPNINLTRTGTFPSTKEPPSSTGTEIKASIEGWADEGAVQASVAITHIAIDDERTVFDPIEFYRLGPPAEFEIVDTPDTAHRTAATDDSYGAVVVKLEDALGQSLTGLGGTGRKLVLEGNNDAAAAILDYDDEEARTLTFSHNARSVGATADDAFSFNIDIKDDATSGDYDVNLVVKEGTGADEMTLASLTIPIEVIGAPDAMDGALSASTVNPGDSLQLTDVMFSSGGQSAFELACHATDTEAPSEPTAAESICDWSGETPADRAVLEGGMGSVNTDGTASIMVKSNAAPDTYTLVISDGRRNADGSVADKEIEFTVRGRPTMYTLTGPDQIGPGEIVEYSVKATDDAGGLPYLPTDVQNVGVVLLGATDYVQTIHVSNGSVMLNALGEASFNVVAATDTPAGSNLIIAIAGVGADPVRKEVSIGPKALGVPTGLTLQTVADDTGTVTLSWTAGANSTRHWIAGIKQEDWDANNFADVLFLEAMSQTGHTFTGLDGGKEYVFTVTAGNAAGEWSDWFTPLQRITVGTPAPTGGSGPGSPFGN